MTPETVRRHFEETGALLSGHFCSPRASTRIATSSARACSSTWERAGALGAAPARSSLRSGPASRSPAMGGVMIGHESGARSGCARSSRSVWTASSRLRRGFTLDEGERVVVVEDVVTTGKSTKEVLDVLRRAGAVPVACGSIVDRRAPAEKTPDVACPYRAPPVPRGSGVGARGVPALRARGAARRPGSRHLRPRRDRGRRLPPRGPR